MLYTLNHLPHKSSMCIMADLIRTQDEMRLNVVT